MELQSFTIIVFVWLTLIGYLGFNVQPIFPPRMGSGNHKGRITHPLRTMCYKCKKLRHCLLFSLGLCKFSVSAFCSFDAEVSTLLCMYLIYSIYGKLYSVSLFGSKNFPLSVPRWCQWPAGSGQSIVALYSDRGSCGISWPYFTVFVTIVFVSNQHFVSYGGR